jgi:hypothetical protein
MKILYCFRAPMAQMRSSPRFIAWTFDMWRIPGHVMDGGKEALGIRFLGYTFIIYERP